MSTSVRVAVAHAKLNLGLRVVGSLPGGYHALETTFQAISLHDLVMVTPSATLEVVCHGFEVAGGPDNLAARAAAALGATARITIHKRIPPGSGMGGASSDAATVLRLLGSDRTPAELNEIAGRLGADVPFFLRGGRAVATGRGEMLQPARADSEWYTIAWPGFAVSTPAVFAAFDLVGGEGVNHLARAAMRTEPRLGVFAEALGPGWTMTGSGAAFYRPSGSREVAQARAGGLAGLGCWVAVASGVGAWG